MTFKSSCKLPVNSFMYNTEKQTIGNIWGCLSKNTLSRANLCIMYLPLFRLKSKIWEILGANLYINLYIIKRENVRDRRNNERCVIIKSSTSCQDVRRLALCRFYYMPYYCRSPRRKWLMTEKLFVQSRMDVGNRVSLFRIRESSDDRDREGKKKKKRREIVSTGVKEELKREKAEVGGIIRSFSKNVEKT